MEKINSNISDFHWLPSYKSGRDRIKFVISIIANVVVSILVFLAAFMPLTYAWSLRKWSDLTINEILYHLSADTTGTGEGMIESLIAESIVPSIICVVIFLLVFRVIIKKKRNIRNIFRGFVALGCIIICVCTVVAFWKEKGITKYLESQATESSFLEENYVDPASVNLTFPEQKRNLIYIFLESTENTFADESVGGAFEENVIPELTQLSLENENFSGDNTTLNGGVPMSGATWTIGAMFAQTSGLPLQISIDKNAMSSQSEFFPGATTLGDILEDNGYKQVLLLGSDAAFGGRELYFTSHGNYEMKDYNYYTSNGTLPSDYYVWWGYEDKYLFQNAKDELNELSQSDQPFNLTMLTVDTHFEDGYVCSECGDEYDSQYSNVYACSSKQVAEFVSWVQQQPFYENTTIVISGDHLTMDSDYCDDVSDDYQRKVYTTVINAPCQPETQEYREYTTFDNFPTTLAALGVQIEGNRLGLGINLYSSEETLYEKYGKPAFNDGLLEKSSLMDELSGGISDVMADITIEEYDSETGTQKIIASELVKTTGFKRLFAYMWKKSDKSDRILLTAKEQDDGTFVFTIPYERFDFEDGTYNFVIYEKAENIADVHVKTLNINFTGTASLGLDGVSGLGTNISCSEFNFESGKFTVTYVPDDTDTNIASTNIGVWSNDDQSDIRWYEATKQDDGTYTVEVDAFEHNTNGKPFNVHAYVVSMDGQMTYKGGVEYTIE